MVLYSWYPLSHFKSSLYLWYIITPVEKLMLRKLKWLTQDHLARDWQSKDSVTGLTPKEQSIHVPWLCLQLLHRNLLEMQTFNLTPILADFDFAFWHNPQASQVPNKVTVLRNLFFRFKGNGGRKQDVLCNHLWARLCAIFNRILCLLITQWPWFQAHHVNI